MMRMHLLLTVSTCLALMPAGGAQAPSVVRFEPADGSRDLPSGAVALRIVFDRDMNTHTGYSIGVAPDGAPFPKVTGKLEWLDARTLSIPVQLDANVAYGCELNRAGTMQLFVDTQGNKLPPTPWHFATRDDDATPIDQPAWNEQGTAALERAILERYSYRDRTGTPWKEVFAQHRKGLLEAASREQWVERAAALLAPARDPHLWFQLQGKVVGTHQTNAAMNVNVRLLPKLLARLEQINNNVLKARTDDDIGYVMVATLDRQAANDVRAVQQVLTDLKDCRALVLDLRPNGGGDELLAREIAAWFVDGEVIYAGHRLIDRDSPDGFGPVQQRSLTGNREPERHFAGPVAVLMGRRNLSSCEAFLLMLKQCPRATLIGTRSGGSSGNPQPAEIGPGVTLMVPSWQALRPDGKSFEGEGITPDIEVTATADDLRTRDPVLEKALEVLRREQ